MDSIYSGAALTIVAAAGKDAEYGLTGISHPRDANSQLRIKVGDFLLVSHNEAPGNILADSHWNTRGWTYQEGILSLRRLVFTDRRIFFSAGECAVWNTSTGHTI